jgi:hypothetical protein
VLSRCSKRSKPLAGGSTGQDAEQKSALIAGASLCIGVVIDERLASECAEVVIAVLTMDPEVPMPEVALLRKMGMKVHPLDGSALPANDFSE